MSKKEKIGQIIFESAFKNSFRDLNEFINTLINNEDCLLEFPNYYSKTYSCEIPVYIIGVSKDHEDYNSKSLAYFACLLNDKNFSAFLICLAKECAQHIENKKLAKKVVEFCIWHEYAHMIDHDNIRSFEEDFDVFPNEVSADAYAFTRLNADNTLINDIYNALLNASLEIFTAKHDKEIPYIEYKIRLSEVIQNRKEMILSLFNHSINLAFLSFI